MKINCIAIDDEPLALKKISGFIARVEYLNLLRMDIQLLAGINPQPPHILLRAARVCGNKVVSKKLRLACLRA